MPLGGQSRKAPSSIGKPSVTEHPVPLVGKVFLMREEAPEGVEARA